MNGIRYQRMKQNMSQEEIANVLLIDRSTIAKWETGASNPTADKIPELAKILKCSIDDLFKSESS